MQVPLPDIICDTGFLMHLATGRIRDTEYTIGSASYVVPDSVISELNGLMRNPAKSHDAAAALQLTDTMRRIQLGTKYVDEAILDYTKTHKVIVATTDKRLKKAIKATGTSVITLHNNNVILE